MPKKDFVFICTGKDCKKLGAKELVKSLKTDKSHRLIKTKCMDACKKAPCVIFHEAQHFKMDNEKLKDLLS